MRWPRTRSQLYTTLQHAYEDLRESQDTILQQERLRALGQMASGIAHDINNAISPVTLYTDALLEQETQMSAQGARVPAHHPARDRRRRRRPSRACASSIGSASASDLAPVDLNPLVNQVLDADAARAGATCRRSAAS